MGSGHFTSVVEGEILSITAGRTNGIPKMILSLRVGSDSFDCLNLCIKPEQAVRLWRDLANLASNSEIMKEAVNETPDYYEFYKTIVTDERVSDGKDQRDRTYK